jgi:hypothetical protein
MPAKKQDGLEQVKLTELRPHPENYRDHPPDQIEHLTASLEEHGFYRNIVIARDGTILAGHGIAKAAELRGDTTVPARRLDIDPDSPQALRILTGDNELGRLAEVDDRQLTELLKRVQESDAGLLGTGVDEMMLANLLTITRTAAEIPDFDAAAEWIGMPDYEADEKPWKMVLSFQTEAERTEFVATHDDITPQYARPGSPTWSGWWPVRTGTRTDSSVKYEATG